MLAPERIQQSPHMSRAEHWPTSSENPEDLRLWDISAVKEAGLFRAGEDPEGSCSAMSCGYLCYVQNQHRLVTHHTLNID